MAQGIAERRLIVVAPLPGEGGDFTANDLVGAWRVVERFVKDYRIDANRLVVHSYGRGGGFAAFMAFENRERVRGLALASSMLQVPPPEADPSYPFHFFFSVNRGDRAEDQLQRRIEVLHELKYAVTVQKASDHEHDYLDVDEVGEVAALDRFARPHLRNGPRVL